MKTVGDLPFDAAWTLGVDDGSGTDEGREHEDEGTHVGETGSAGRGCDDVGTPAIAAR